MYWLLHNFKAIIINDIYVGKSLYMVLVVIVLVLLLLANCKGLFN